MTKLINITVTLTRGSLLGLAVQVVMVMTTWLIHVACSTTTRLINMTVTLLAMKIKLHACEVQRIRTSQENIFIAINSLFFGVLLVCRRIPLG